VTEDDAEARRRRARELRREIEELRQGRRAALPPRSPYEFIEREMREPAEEERRARGEANSVDEASDAGKPDSQDGPPSH